MASPISLQCIIACCGIRNLVSPSVTSHVHTTPGPHTLAMRPSYGDSSPIKVRGLAAIMNNRLWSGSSVMVSCAFVLTVVTMARAQQASSNVATATANVTVSAPNAANKDGVRPSIQDVQSLTNAVTELTLAVRKPGLPAAAVPPIDNSKRISDLEKRINLLEYQLACCPRCGATHLNGDFLCVPLRQSGFAPPNLEWSRSLAVPSQFGRALVQDRLGFAQASESEVQT